MGQQDAVAVCIGMELCVGGVCYECDIVCAVDDAAILVSIVVSIPACHAV